MAIRDFASTATGGWKVVNGDFAVVSDQDAVQQGIAIRIRMFLGENAYDVSKGLDWLGTILVKGTDPLVVRALISEQILDTPDVTDLLATSIQETDPTTRAWGINYQVETVYSTVPLASSVTIAA